VPEAPPTLTFCSHVSPADWITTSRLPWKRLVTFGPESFAAHARLRFLPDPAYLGQSESDVESDESHCESAQLPVLYELLAAHTRTPDDCYFCLWEGFGDLYGKSVHRTLVLKTSTYRRWTAAPAFPLSVLEGRRVVVPHRTYLLFRGPLSSAGQWGAAETLPGQPREYLPTAFAWPADHAWCVVHDVDPHWAGIGADAPVIDQLVAEPRLDVVRADPNAAQPSFS
jgi:hypothetical protein